MKGGTRRVPRGVPPKLNMPLSNGGEGDISADKKLTKTRGIDNESTSLIHTVVVTRNKTPPKGGKGLALSRGQVSFLEADDVIGSDKVREGAKNQRTTEGVGRVEGEAVNVVRKNVRNASERRREGREE